MSMTQELERGRMAAEVLENPVFRDALDQINAEIVTKWQVEKDEKVRDWLWTLMQASKRLDSILTETMNTGILANKQLELERSRAERIGATLRRSLGR